MSVAKVIELMAEGTTLEEATEEAVRQAGKTVDGIRNVYVDNWRAIVEDGEIDHYRVHAKVTFVIKS